eukprot:4551902-Lingulodinium_polyedra.AAC.2
MGLDRTWNQSKISQPHQLHIIPDQYGPRQSNPAQTGLGQTGLAWGSGPIRHGLDWAGFYLAGPLQTQTNPMTGLASNGLPWTGLI